MFSRLTAGSGEQRKLKEKAMSEEIEKLTKNAEQADAHVK